MWKINYDLKKLIPPNKEEYRFIKSFKLNIPCKDIGLQVLVRKEQQLSLFFEIILKLVNSQFNNVTEIANLTGVDQDILNDVIGEMSRNELIYPKGNNLLLTPDGKEALDSLTEVTIEKENINRIFINLITGEIMDLDNPIIRPLDDNPCLDEIIKIDDEFIYKNFNRFNDFYLKKQEFYETSSYNNKVKNEIYQILNKEYEKLCYIEKNTFIYENIRDKDIIFECENDSENLFGTIFSKQIDRSTGVRRFLRGYMSVKKYFNNELALDSLKEEKEQNANLLIENVLAKENVNEDIDNYYFKDRYLFEKEYNEILLSLKEIKPSEVIIISDNLKSILNHNVITTLETILDSCKITIIADEEEWKINELKNKVISHKLKKKNEIKWDFSKNINRTKILLYPQAFINIEYVPIKLRGDYLINEVAEITFDENKIKAQRDMLLKIV